MDDSVAMGVDAPSGARPSQQPSGVPPVVLTSRERALVTLLADGQTDASAARELGVSPRSVTYTLRALMDRLGVDNRFQLGLALGAMNAVPLPGEAGETPADRPPHR
jgi:DNA-binding NarL/FixJ family response regulator